MISLRTGSRTVNRTRARLKVCGRAHRFNIFRNGMNDNAAMRPPRQTTQARRAETMTEQTRSIWASVMSKRDGSQRPRREISTAFENAASSSSRYGPWWWSGCQNARHPMFAASRAAMTRKRSCTRMSVHCLTSPGSSMGGKVNPGWLARYST